MSDKKKTFQNKKPWKVGLSFAIGLSILSFSPDLAEANGKKWDFNFTGNQQSWTVPASGDYKLEVWGAQGSTRHGDGGGKGGYSSSVVKLNSNSTIYVNVGGQNGFNGGGAPSNLAGGYGGGGTDFRVEGNSLYHRLLVAGGGGGQFNGTPGVGGGDSGGSASFRGTQYGGTQTAGGYSSRNGQSGSFGQGGNAYYGGGASGGGGGWYGGAGGSTDYSAYYDADDDSGAGGSGYVLTSSSHKPSGYALDARYYTSEATLLSGAQTMPSPTGGTQVGQSGNGFARITQLVVPPRLTITPSTTAWTTQNVSFAVAMQQGDHDIKEMILPDGTKTADVSRTYTVSNNGTYIFKAIDVMGNETVETVTVSNIDKTSPTATLSAASPSGNRVKLNLSSIVDTGGSGIKSILLPNGTIATGSTASYTVSKNGIYEFVITDNAGNQTVKSIEVKTLNDSTIEWSFGYSGVIEEFPIPRSGKYKVETWGAEGGRGYSNYTAGKGAYAVSVLNLNENDWLKVLVGQQGLNNGSYIGSGGGGSFVAKGDDTPVAVAGGGGGAYYNSYSGTYYHGQPTRQVAQFTPYTQQQSEGQGGFAGYNGWSYPSTAGAGGGFYGDGMANSYSGAGSAGYAFVNGGGSGKDYAYGAHGGFGGGGGTNYVGGGGGGYTGGHAGTGHSGSYHTGGGGGSYFTGAEGFAKGGWETMPTVAGTGSQTGNSGNGAVKITRMVTPPEFSINVPTLSWTNEGFNATVNVSADGEYEYVKMILPNGTETTSRNFTYPIASNGTFKFTAVDANGYRHEKTLEITNIEKNAPTGSESVSTTGWTTNNVTITATGNDTGGSGLKTIELKGDYPGKNLLKNSNREVRGTNEFVQFADVANIFDKYGQVPVTISFDIKADVAGDVQVYMQNGSDSRHSIGYQKVEVGTAYTRQSVTVTPKIQNGGLSKSMLAFYGQYGTGRIINVKNVKIELGSNATPYSTSPEDALMSGNRRTFDISQNGTHTVVYEDHAGNKTERNVTISNIDKEGAVATFSPNETVGWVNSNQNIRITPEDMGVSGISYYRYRTSSNNGASWSGWYGNYSSAINVNLYQGENLIEVELYDRAGNRSTVRSGLYRVDTTMPNASLSVSTSSWTKEDVTLNLTSVSDSGGSALKHIELPNGQIVTGTSASYTVSENGTYTFKIVDHAGNERVVSRNVSNIDKTLPTGTLSLSNPNLTNGGVYIYARGNDSNSGFSRIVLPNNGVSYSTAYNYYVTENGSYTFEFYDVAGNVYTETIVVDTIDRIAPTYSFSPNGTPTVNGTNYTKDDVTVEMNVSDEGVAGMNYWQYRIYDNNYGYRNWTNMGTADKESVTFDRSGTYFLQLQAYDKAGNSVGTQQSQYYYIDKTEPYASMSYSTTSPTRNDVTLYLNSIGDSHSGVREVVMPNGTVYQGASNRGYTVSENGTYVFKVRDRAGNEKEFTYVVSNIDKTMPTFTLSKDGGDWSKTPHKVSIESDDADSGVNYTQYAWSTSPTSEPYYYSWTTYSSGELTQPGTGTYYLWVRVQDRAGNLFTDKSKAFQYETSAPNGSVSASTTSWTAGNVMLSVNGVSDGGGSGFKHITLPNGSVVTNMNPSYEVTENGSYEFIIEDHAGNQTKRTINVTNIDKTAPTGTFNQPSKSWTNQDVTLSVSGITDIGSGFKHVVLPNGQTVRSTSASYVVTENGTYTFELVDNVGNVFEKVFIIDNIDKSAPTASFTKTPSGFTTSDVEILMNNVAETQSGFKQVTLPDGSVSTNPTNRFVAKTNGSYRFVLEDRAGNRREVDVVVNNIDREKPIAQVVGVPDKGKQILRLQNITDGTGSGVQSVRLPNGTVLGAVSNVNYPVSANGWYAFVVTDKLGNAETYRYHVNNLGENSVSDEFLSSGIEFAEYQLNGAKSQDWTPLDLDKVTALGGFEVLIDRVGVTHLVVNARDHVGNVEMKMRAYLVDDEGETVAPMKNIRYRLTGATTRDWTDYGAPFVISNEGVTTIHVTAEDIAGNQANVTREVKIDKSSPINNAVTVTLD